MGISRNIWLKIITYPHIFMIQ